MVAAPKRLCILCISAPSLPAPPAQRAGAVPRRLRHAASQDGRPGQKRREVEEHEHRLAAEAQEQALATRIGDLCEDFLADAGAGMIPNVFDRVAIGFAALQDAFVEETKHFAHEAAEAAHLRAQAGLDRARFQNATLRVQLEQNRIAAQQVQEQMKLQLRIAKQRSTRHGGSNPVAAE